MEKQLVNTDKLYSVIGKFFTHKDNLMLELLQNASRAHAREVVIEAPYLREHPFNDETDPDKLIRIWDNGTGIEDIVALLGIAISDWNMDIDSQEPAGMGFLQLLALSNKIFIRSAFGQLELDSPRFLQDSSYRQGIVNTDFDSQPGYAGTEIIAEMHTSAFFYLKSDYGWYTGYKDMNITINGKKLVSISMDKLEQEARQKQNLVCRTEYEGNPLFIEIGDPGLLVGTSRSCINWYGQLIPSCFEVDYYLSSMFIRYYYEISQGTPLTPRYPDRTMLTMDDKWEAFSTFLVETITRVLADYFSNLENSTFRRWTCYHLLQFLYRHGDKAVLEKLEWIPVDLDVFTSQDHYDFGIMKKADLVKHGYYYTTEDLRVDDDFYLGFDTDQFKCVKVSDKVTPYLAKLDLHEINGIRAVNPGKDLIQTQPLELEFLYEDNLVTSLKLQNALLYDHNYCLRVIALDVGQVMGVFDNYWEHVADYNSEESVDEQEKTLRDEIWHALTTQFKLMPDDRFCFLPRYYDLKNISFEDGNLAVSYKDGSSLSFALR